MISQSSAARAGGAKSRNVVDTSPPAPRPSSARAAVAGPTPGRRSRTRKPCDPVARIFREAKHRENILHVRRIKEFQSAELDEWNVTPRELDFERSAVVRRPKQDSPGPSAPCRFRDSRAPSRRHSAPGRLRRARSPAAAARLTVRSDQRFLVKRSDARSMTALAAARIGCVER